MKKHLSFLFVAVAIACTRNASAATVGLGAAGLGADTLSLPGIHSAVTTGSIAMAVRRGNAIGAVSEFMGSGDGVRLDGATATLGYSPARGGVIALMPELRIGMLSVVGPGDIGASTGSALGGLAVVDQANSLVAYNLEALVGETFAASSSTGDGSGRAYKVGVGASESLTRRVTLAERYSDERLTVGNGAIADHSTTISIADRF